MLCLPKSSFQFCLFTFPIAVSYCTTKFVFSISFSSEKVTVCLRLSGTHFFISSEGKFFFLWVSICEMVSTKPKAFFTLLRLFPDSSNAFGKWYSIASTNVLISSFWLCRERVIRIPVFLIGTAG
ncbi:hypothetical protein D3C85_910210 [compost metagenome]